MNLNWGTTSSDSNAFTLMLSGLYTELEVAGRLRTTTTAHNTAQGGLVDSVPVGFENLANYIRRLSDSIVLVLSPMYDVSTRAERASPTRAQTRPLPVCAVPWDVNRLPLLLSAGSQTLVSASANIYSTSVLSFTQLALLAFLSVLFSSFSAPALCVPFIPPSFSFSL